jgi:hypothetical protein
MKALVTFCIVALLLCPILAFSGTTGKIAGTVRDARTNEPLPSANVVIEGTAIGAATNMDGYFVILNIPPGRYKVTASLVGFRNSSALNVRVDIDQTTDLNLKLSEEAVTGEEVTVIAARPVIVRDVAASRANIEAADIDKLPITSVTSAVTLQAGIQGGLVIRGGGADQTVFVVDGMMLRDERTNQPFTGISLSSIQDVQVQTGGFNAEYGNLRSGVVNVVTREGSTSKYSFNFIGRYRPAAPKHFGASIYDFNSYWVRPYVDDAVCWTGTSTVGSNGSPVWDKWTATQYPDFEGWNSVSQKLLAAGVALSPAAAQEVWLWEHRRQSEIKDPDWDVDMGFGGPFPYASEQLGNLRFFASYRQQVTQYLVPLSREAYRDYNGQLKITSDIAPGMKLMVSGLIAQQDGTTDNNVGSAGIFRTASDIASSLTSSNSVSGYVDARFFGTDYWAPTTTNIRMFGAKLSHAISSSTFYEGSLQWYFQGTDTWPGTLRNTAKTYLFGNDYYLDEAPFGYMPFASTGIVGMRMGVGMSNSRDRSRVQTTTLKFDITSQMDKFNQVKAGLELGYTDNDVTAYNEDIVLPTGRYSQSWHNYPIRAALYLQDKLEFEGMIASLGLRFEYLNPNGDWWEYQDDPFNSAFGGQGDIDTMLQVVNAPSTLTVSPRLAIAFPISDEAKFFFNYGHFRQVPDPTNVFMLSRYTDNSQVRSIADPGALFPKTVQYELGYEHSLYDEYLLRVAAYYKDVSNQGKTVSYYGRNSLVSYTRRTSNQYQDIRGFEIQLNKNRGNWVQGFLNYTYNVVTTGYFGLGSYFESAADQRDYEASNVYQEKPIPQPYARANIDFFTPSEFGPEFSGIYLLGDWRLNFIGSWQAGRYATWAGGGAISGLEYNVQWEDYWNVDMRLSKNFKLGPANLQLFVDVSNMLNFRYFPGTYGFFGTEDYNNYMKSLHMPDFPDQFKTAIGYINISGDDRPGAVRKEGVAFQPIVTVALLTDMQKTANQQTRPFYYVAEDRQYYQWVNGQMQKVEQGKLDQVMDDKAYIDMPNQEAFTFLNPRNIFYGIRLSFEL